MKKQINPTIKAHLTRSAFYLLLLLAVCAIPFALAQSRSRATAKQIAAKPNQTLNLAASGFKPASQLRNDVMRIPGNSRGVLAVGIGGVRSPGPLIGCGFNLNGT